MNRLRMGRQDSILLSELDSLALTWEHQLSEHKLEPEQEPELELELELVPPSSATAGVGHGVGHGKPE